MNLQEVFILITIEVLAAYAIVLTTILAYSCGKFQKEILIKKMFEE